MPGLTETDGLADLQRDILAACRRPAAEAQPETVTSCHSPPFRLRLLPWAWPGAVSPM